MEFCCDAMKKAVVEDGVVEASNHRYTAQSRSNRSVYVNYEMQYCVWCGKKLT